MGELHDGLRDGIWWMNIYCEMQYFHECYAEYLTTEQDELESNALA